MVAATQAEQPHWAPPMAMGQPLLDQVFRYDISWQKLPDGHTLNNFGSGKGFEFIVAKRVELGIAVPAWLTQESPPGAQKRGWADENFFIKYRLAAGNETNGNYSAVALLNVSAPTGSEAYTAHHFIFTPTLGFGKGWGNSAIQSTVAISVPDNGVTSNGMGTPIAVNVAAQYHWRKIFWPEVELNYTHWPNGVNEGRNQLLITPGLVLGKFQVWRRAGFQIGVAYQVALTEDPTYRRNFILSARFPF